MRDPTLEVTQHEPEAGAAPDTAYVLSRDGFIYASARIHSGVTARPGPVLLLSANHAPFELGLANGKVLHANAAVVAPRVARSLDARGVPLLSFNLTPSHRSFHVFAALRRAGVLALDRQAFAPLDDAFVVLHEGTASVTLAEQVFRQAVSEALRQMPPVAAPDPRALEILRMLKAEPQLSPDALGRRCGRSPQTVSRLFSSAMGLSLRDYQSWLRQQPLLELMYSQRTLTEVALATGFSDSPQFSRTFQRWYGQSPSFNRNPKFVRVRMHRGGNPPANPHGLG